MRLSEKTIPRRYNALANSWTPLSWKPCWLSIAVHCTRNYMKRNRLVLISFADSIVKDSSADNKLHCACDKSFADDLEPSRYCKHESNLCITICWDFSGVFRFVPPVLLIGWKCMGIMGIVSLAGGALFARYGSWFLGSTASLRRVSKFLTEDQDFCS